MPPRDDNIRGWRCSICQSGSKLVVRRLIGNATESEGVYIKRRTSEPTLVNSVPGLRELIAIVRKTFSPSFPFFFSFIFDGSCRSFRREKWEGFGLSFHRVIKFHRDQSDNLILIKLRARWELSILLYSRGSKPWSPESFVASPETDEKSFVSIWSLNIIFVNTIF